MKPNPPVKQSGVGSDSLDALMARAAALKESFRTRIIDPLSKAGTAADNPRYALCGLKGGPRTYEKVKMEYNGDHTLVKDLLRGCVVSPTIDDLCVVFSRFRQLSTRGVCEIVQIKNRYRDGQAPSGYADVHLVIRFEGHLCEVQLLLEDFYRLKNEQTPIYDFCRALGLVGALPPMAPEYAYVTDLNACTALSVIFLRWLGATISALLTAG